jgi:hypothetical protein
MKKIAALLTLLAAVSACSKSNNPNSPSNNTPTKIISLSGSLNFGNVNVGQSANLTFTISNTGNTTLTISGMTVNNGLSSVLGASWTGGSIAAGSSQQVTLQFAPTAAQVYSGTLTVNGDFTSGSNTLAVSGTGVALLKANITLASNTGTYICSTGLCTSFQYAITNTGPGCASNVSVVTRFYGSNGNGPQLGIDVPMFAPGQTLSNILFRVGTTVTVQNTINFNDIRSAQTVFRAFITWNDVPCS